MEENIQVASGRRLKWYNIINPGKKEVKSLRDQFHFHDLDLVDVLSVTQRSKGNRYDRYLFFVLLFPIYNRQYQSIETAEVDFFVTKNALITVHNGQLAPLNDLFSLCQLNGTEKKECLGTDMANLLYGLLSRLWGYCFPMLDHISIDIHNIETQIFSGNKKQLVQDILTIRQNIIMFRKLLQPHRNVLTKVITPSKRKGDFEIVHTHEEVLYFDDLVDHLKEMWDTLSTLKESVDVLAQTNESLISFRINETIRVLTTISVTLMPVSLIAWIFAMRTSDVPIVGSKGDFWIILLMMAGAFLFTLGFFRRKHWI